MALGAALAAIAALSAAASGAVLRDSGTNKHSCEAYDLACFATAANEAECAAKPEVCPAGETHCYAVWTTQPRNASDTSKSAETELVIKKMGCFQGSLDCEDNVNTCLSRRVKNDHHFCCCTGAMCNVDFMHMPGSDNSTVPEGEPPPLAPPDQSMGGVVQVLIVVAVVFVVVVLAVAAFYVFRQRKLAESARSHGAVNDDIVSPPSPKLTRMNVELLEIKARGRFGAVWRGRAAEAGPMAIKIFPLAEKGSWYAEQEIYNLPRMEHPNILEFMGVDKRGDGLQQEFWLMTKYHEKGSLYDFLKSNTVCWADVCKIAYSMASGLSHLHEELAPKNTLDLKPAVAHRDFKSKNVLIKADMTACIGDFGLALIFEPGKSCGDTHGQVGTRRYMAPEVLEGAINFSRDSFLRIDMYACGLVLWELASRCSMGGLEQPREYKLPFEEEAVHPTLEQMQDLVVNKKLRPVIPPSWTDSPVMSELVETIKDCWDQDAEARLSASNVKERVKAMREATAPQNMEAHLNELNRAAADDGGQQALEMTPLIANGGLGSSTAADQAC